MSHNIYTEKFTTATSLRNEILKKQDKKIKILTTIIKMFLGIVSDIDSIRARNQQREIQLKIKERTEALILVFNNLDKTELVLRELLGTRALTAMTNNFTTAEENIIAKKITEIFEMLENV